jgi:hypothetical protein
MSEIPLWYKAALRKYLNTHSFCSADEFLMCKDDLQYYLWNFIIHDTKNCIWFCIYEMFQILLFCDTLIGPRNVYMYVYFYYVCVYVWIYKDKGTIVNHNIRI